MEVRSEADLQAIQTSVAFKNSYDAIEQYMLLMELIPPITVVPKISRMRGKNSTCKLFRLLSP